MRPFLPYWRALFAVLLSSSIPVASASAQPTADSVRRAARAWHRTHERAILGELVTLLAIPNLASDSVGIRRNADTLVAMLTRRGVSARRLESPGSPPAVFGELRTPGATRTIVFYAHYDGQPLRPEEWRTPPWTPTFFAGRAADGAAPVSGIPEHPTGEWRLHARSASDDKGPIVAMLAALDALRAAGVTPAVNLKFFFDGEEEAGSPHVSELLQRHRALLGADLWLFTDGPVHQSRRQQVLFGVRGMMGAELTLYGPARALHSGHYGNWAPNPVASLASLVASMRAPDGRITIAGFGDDVRPPTAAEHAAVAKMPTVEAALKRDLLIASAEGGDGLVAERIMRPSINLRGIVGGVVGANAANAIPTEARASLDFRLVPVQTPERVRKLVEAHARAQGFHVVHEVPTDSVRRLFPNVLRIDWGPGYAATRAPMDAPISRALLRVVDEALDAPAIRVPTLGGSLPMHDFEQTLGAPLIVLPIVNHDNDQHAANENLRLQNLWDGIELFAAVMTRLRW